jgi:hypothetical protein
MPSQNVFIAKRETTGVKVTFCAPYTNTFVCTSWPVFSEGTTDGTTAYLANTTLKQLDPPGSYVLPNAPTFTYDQPSGTGVITFNYGLTFQPTPREYQAASNPRRYKYILALTGYSPGNEWAASHTAHSSVALHGQVDVYVGGTQVTSSISICSLQVV